MTKPLLTALLCALFSISAGAQETSPESGASAAAAPGTVVITGQRPGPGLWKVSKGDNVLWLFGTYGPLPKDMRWRSEQAETLLAQSQELIYPPTAGYNPGFFRGITLLPHAINLKKNPDGKTLRELLPAEVHDRWLLLKHKYIGDDSGIERERPYFAAQRLYDRALQHAGLAGTAQVDETIAAVAKRHKLRITRPAIALQVDEPAALIKQFKKTPMEDSACFAATLARLESDLDTMRVRANAWAKGDIEVMRGIDFAEREGACDKAFKQTAGVKDLYEGQQVEARMQAAWIEAARKALDTNKSTFALMPIRHLLGARDIIAALRAEGYAVESPE